MLQNDLESLSNRINALTPTTDPKEIDEIFKFFFEINEKYTELITLPKSELSVTRLAEIDEKLKSTLQSLQEAVNNYYSELLNNLIEENTRFAESLANLEVLPIQKNVPLLNVIQQLNDIDKSLMLLNLKIKDIEAKVDPVNLKIILEKREINQNKLAEIQQKIIRQHTYNLRGEIHQKFEAELSVYLTKRQDKYLIKDMITQSDKTIREEFIKKVNQKLYDFRISDNALLISFIKENKELYKGYNLTSILNRILVKIEEYQNKVSNNFIEKPQVEKHEITQKLNQYKDKVFANKINQLRLKIDNMYDYGNKLLTSDISAANLTMELAAGLQKRVDEFIMQDFPNLDNFISNFKIHLHSYDDVMHQHRLSWSWKPILSEILNVLTLFIPAAVSKLYCGQAFFFAFNINRMNKIEEIDVTINAIASPAA